MLQRFCILVLQRVMQDNIVGKFQWVEKHKSSTFQSGSITVWHLRLKFIMIYFLIACSKILSVDERCELVLSNWTQTRGTSIYQWFWGHFSDITGRTFITSIFLIIFLFSLRICWHSSVYKTFLFAVVATLTK